MNYKYRLSDKLESATLLLKSEDIRSRIVQMASEISQDYAGKVPILVGVLKGASIFMSDLVRLIETELELDYMAVSSYGSSTETSGVVRILKDLEADITGRDVLIVEDIVDSGLTLKYLRRNLISRSPSSLEVAALMVKHKAGSTKKDIKYLGFEIDNHFVVGYGLDLDERFRNLPDVWCFKA